MYSYPRACEHRGEATPDDIEENPMALTIANIVVTTQQSWCRIECADWGGKRCMSPKIGERQKEEHIGKSKFDSDVLRSYPRNVFRGWGILAQTLCCV